MKQKDLIAGCFYFGEGRFVGNIAMWTGNLFCGFANKWGLYTETSALYGEFGFSPEYKIIRKSNLNKD